ncbi:hypothetical protein FGE12_16050 [Aggregicoccus sp. 17bor-14]|uniref:hypothetical protein n=1 Tax=Myxococcaceae TaxID=31 RepID=UPI00129CAF62|nr:MULTISPECIES: hypothetical protein [Myxococcaceae]MBF5043914.1 hypothetical protein [Simulacricoccus sp. 17bor-14]MRI89665.1 hypothetical protein [Aggregicoccus sp. 17bor-14]
MARPGAPRLCIRGNAVLAEGVYRALLSPPPDVRADEEAAANVQGQLSSFLTRAGYTLGSVAVTVEGPDLLADVDEGQLERVVLRGRLSWRALRLWLGLSIPSGVFNQGALEQQLTRLREELRLERVWYELVPTRGVTHTGPQADELAVLQSLGVAEVRHPFELHVFVQEPAWREGVGVEVRSGAQYGQEVLGAYQGSGLLLGRDRWSARLGVGMRMQHPVGDGGLRPVPTRVLGEVRWFAPPLIGASARPYLLLQGDVVRERRGDLGLEASYQLETAGSLNLLVEPWRRLTLSTGVGGRYADVLGVDTVGGSVALPEVAEQVHQPRMDLFVQARAERVFSGQAGRVDRMHALSLDARHHLGVKEASFTEVRAEYRKAWGIGWHDLLLRGRGTYLLGGVAYPDEEPLSRHLRGIAGDEHLRRGGSVSAEFQWSLLRDVYRASVFHDFATFGRLVRTSGTERLTWGNSFGVGLHALYEGTLQFNLYGALGKTPEDRELRKGFVFEVQKVF